MGISPLLVYFVFLHILIMGDNMSFRICWKTHIICVIIAFIMILFHEDMVVNISVYLSLISPNMNSPVTIFIYQYIILLLFMIPVSIIHELIHGWVYRIFGCRVKYGFKVLYAYTQEISQKQLGLIKFIFVLLSPVVFISFISVIIPGRIMDIVYLLNLLGSSGDIYMTVYLLRFNSKCKIIDRSYGFDIVDNNAAEVNNNIGRL